MNDPILIHIRWMIRRDLPEVLEIAAASFEFPWNEDDFITCMRRRNVIGMVCEFDGMIIGYMMYELHKEFLYILQMAVEEKSRQHSVGTQMIDKLKDKLTVQRRRRLAMEVRETNISAQYWLHSHGFQAVNVMRGFYPDTNEDAYLFHFDHPIIEREMAAVRQ